MIPQLDYGSLRAVAKGFLATYHPSDTIPIPIEEILDLQFKINIVPVPGLHDVEETVGLSSSDFTAIYIDQHVYEKRLQRFRFTLAHELSHHLIHRKLYNHRPFSTIDGWREFVNNLDELEYIAYERQANDLAGLLLCPTAQLHKQFETQKIKLRGNTLLANVTDETIIEAMAGPIAIELVVGTSIVTARLKAERWNPRS